MFYIQTEVKIAKTDKKLFIKIYVINFELKKIKNDDNSFILAKNIWSINDKLKTILIKVYR